MPGVDYGDCKRYEGEDPETIEKMQQDDIRHCTRDLLLVERAKEVVAGGRPIIMARKKELPPPAEISDELLSRFKAIITLTDAFCKRYLNEEYVKMCRRLAMALARKRPTPITRGRAEVWACGIVRTIGWAPCGSGRRLLVEGAPNLPVPSGFFHRLIGRNSGWGRGQRCSRSRYFLAELYRRDVLGTRAFLPLTFRVRYLLAHLQFLETDALEGRGVEEQVFSAPYVDESKSLVRQFLDSAFGHLCVFRSDVRFDAALPPASIWGSVPSHGPLCKRIAELGFPFDRAV